VLLCVVIPSVVSHVLVPCVALVLMPSVASHVLVPCVALVCADSWWCFPWLAHCFDTFVLFLYTMLCVLAPCVVFGWCLSFVGSLCPFSCVGSGG